MYFVCVILGVMLCCLANRLLHAFVVSAIFSTLITERVFIDGVTMGHDVC